MRDTERQRRRREFEHYYGIASKRFECSDELIAEEMGYADVKGLRQLVTGSSQSTDLTKLRKLRTFVEALREVERGAEPEPQQTNGLALDMRPGSDPIEIVIRVEVVPVSQQSA